MDVGIGLVEACEVDVADESDTFPVSSKALGVGMGVVTADEVDRVPTVIAFVVLGVIFSTCDVAFDCTFLYWRLWRVMLNLNF